MQISEWQGRGLRFLYKGLPVFYVDEGEGDVLLLVHGFPTCSWDWHQLWQPLSQRYRIITADMLGFCVSAKPVAYGYSIFDQADLFESLLAAREIERVHIVAHNYGDTVVQELLARAAEKKLAFGIDSVCLLNGGIFPEAQRPLLIQKLLAGPAGALVGRLVTRGSFERSMRRIAGHAAKPTPEELQNLWYFVNYNNGRRVMHRLIRYLHERAEFRDRWVTALTEAGCPQRFIVGMADPVSGSAMAARYRELIPQGDLIELAGVGHYPQLEAPQAVLSYVLEFLGQIADGGLA